MGCLFNNLESYGELLLRLTELSPSDQTSLLRTSFRTDLFFLLWYGFNRKDLAHPWLLGRCIEVSGSPDEHLDLWARDHYKSTIITVGQTIQDILRSHGEDSVGRECTVGIFSHTRPIAKGFLRQIMRELESNRILQHTFPDILYENPRRDSPKWSEDDGIIVRRRGNPKEATVEAWGLVEGMPTGKHFTHRVYDDVVTRDSVSSPEMIHKTTEAWELSTNLGTHNGISRYIGTRYHFNDTYKTILDRKAAVPRIYPATEDGTMNGVPVLISRESLEKKLREMGSYTFSSQMLQNPVADSTLNFQRSWLQHYEGANTGENMNVYLLVDPASAKKKTSDYTAMMVIGLGSDENYYILDMVRDRMSLTERTNALFRLHKKWKPRLTAYEKYGMQADTEHIKDRQARENYRFHIEELSGAQNKEDRIRRLLPIFENKRMWMPSTLYRTDYNGKTQDLVEIFINEEYAAFPVSQHDDMLDCLARILDIPKVWPMPEEKEDDKVVSLYYKKSNSRRGTPWAI